MYITILLISSFVLALLALGLVHKNSKKSYDGLVLHNSLFPEGVKSKDNDVYSNILHYVPDKERVDKIIEDSGETEDTITHIFVYHKGNADVAGTNHKERLTALRDNYNRINRHYLEEDDDKGLLSKIGSIISKDPGERYINKHRRSISKDFKKRFGNNKKLSYAQKEGVLNDHQYEGYTEKDLEDLHSRIKQQEEDLKKGIEDSVEDMNYIDIDYDAISDIIDHPELRSDDGLYKKIGSLLNKGIDDAYKKDESSIERLLSLVEGFKEHVDGNKEDSLYGIYSQIKIEKISDDIKKEDLKGATHDLNDFKTFLKEHNLDEKAYLNMMDLEVLSPLTKIFYENKEIDRSAKETFEELKDTIVDKKKKEIIYDSGLIDRIFDDLSNKIQGAEKDENYIEINNLISHSIRVNDFNEILEFLRDNIDIGSSTIRPNVENTIKIENLKNYISDGDIKDSFKDAIRAKLSYMIDKDKIIKKYVINDFEKINVKEEKDDDDINTVDRLSSKKKINPVDDINDFKESIDEITEGYEKQIDLIEPDNSEGISIDISAILNPKTEKSKRTKDSK